jgi:hypothetical protein
MCGLEGFDVADEIMGLSARVSFHNKKLHNSIISYIRERQKILINDAVSVIRHINKTPM